jgi:hypothetical protein
MMNLINCRSLKLDARGKPVAAFPDPAAKNAPELLAHRWIGWGMAVDVEERLKETLSLSDGYFWTAQD